MTQEQSLYSSYPGRDAKGSVPNASEQLLYPSSSYSHPNKSYIK